MAEEIRLVGSFTDNITPKLRKLNREINNVTKSFTKMQARLRPITKEMGVLAMATERTANALKAQRTGLDSNTRAFGAYNRAMGKSIAAQRRFNPKVPQAPKAPGTVPMAAPMVGGFVGGGAIQAGAMTFGITLGQTISEGLRKGLDMGMKMAMEPLKKVFKGLGAAIMDGVEDESSDITSAGGMFALDKKNPLEDRLFKSFADARDMQEELNRELAVSAAALPGATSDYVQAAKQLTDTVMGTFIKDKSAFAELAVSLGGQQGGTDQENITQVLKRFTEQSVLLSQGAGKGGMPLGMLLEQLITMENVNVDTMKRRYAQLRKNPLLANMLKDAEESINEAGAGTADRFSAVMEALENALPEEVVNAHRRSVAGVMEAIRSGLMDQEVGLLGLRRPLKTMVAKVNDFGQYVDKTGKVVASAEDAFKENTTVFKLLRDIIANFGLPLSNIIDILPEVFDPLEGMADALMQLRETSVELYRTFNEFTNFYKKLGYDDAGARGAFAAFTNIMASLGGLTEAERMFNLDELRKDNINWGEFTARIFDQFLNSALAFDIGEAVGGFLGSVVSSLATVMTKGVEALSGEGSNQLLAGFMGAWEAAGGSDALKTIFTTAFDLLGKALIKFVTTFPFESLVLALVALAPALMAGVASAVAAALPSMLSGLLAGGGTAAAGTAAAGTAGAGAAAAGGAGLLAALASPAAIVAAVAGLAIVAKATEGIREEFVGTLRGNAEAATASAVKQDQAGDPFGALLTFIQGEFMHVVADFVKGFGDIFTGLYNIVVGIFTDPAMVSEGIMQILSGLWSLFTMVGHLIIGLASSIPAIVGGILVALRNLIFGVVQAIGTLAGMGLNWIGEQLGGAVQTLISNITGWIGSAWNNRPRWMGGSGGQSEDDASSSYDGNTSRTMGLSQAIATEEKNKPAGSHLVIANSSETVIPAYKGYVPKTKSAIPAFEGYMPEMKAKPAFEGHMPEKIALPAFTGYMPEEIALPAFTGYMPEKIALPAFTGYEPETKAEPAFKGYMAEPAFEGAVAQPAYGGMGESNTTINFNPTINTGNDMDADDLANLMAAKVMEAVQEATYNEVYQS